jgi:hypothetical protein
MIILRRLAVLGVLLLAAATAPQAHALMQLTTGFSQDPLLTGDSAATRATWIPRAVAEGAGMVRIDLPWSQVAPGRRAAGFVASDPASPGYDWTAVDAAVRDLTSHGLQLLMNVTTAPVWAEGAHPAAGAPAGTWKPSAAQLADFATAAARRYDGHFPDPLAPGTSLPRVRDWQAWNEPNLSTYLTPQWTRTAHGYAPASPLIYRDLLNAFYASVKRVSRSNVIVTAGTAPYGDLPGGERMPPVAFDRVLFCLSGRIRLSPTACPDPPHLDVLAHHAYGVGGPLWHALNPDDAAVPDFDKIAGVLHAAERVGHVLPAGPKQLWDDEIGWDSNPPDPDGVPIEKQARWVEQAMYELWHQGVDTVLWLQIGDAPPIPNYADTYQGGMYYQNGKPKPAATAFAFPFVTQRLSETHIQAWGRAPSGGRLRIEMRHGAGWTVVRRLNVGARQVFAVTLTVRGRAVYRAQVGDVTSLTWTQPK